MTSRGLRAKAAYGYESIKYSALICVIVVFLLPAQIIGQAPHAVTPTKPPARTAPITKEILASYEGQTVSSIEFAGRPDLDTSKLERLLIQKKGESFSRTKVDQSIAALKSTGTFQDVQLDVVPDVNGVRVMLVLQPGMYFGMYQFPGAVERFSYTRLLQVANYPPEGPYTQSDVANAVRALTEFFHRAGFFLAEVHPEIQANAQHGIVNVTFHTVLGKRAKFGNVKLEGTTPVETERLTKKLHSTMARLRAAAVRPGKKYSIRTLQNASLYLEKSLSKEHHLGAQVKLIGAEYDRETNRADVSFRVQTGPITNVKIEGAHLWPWTRRKLLPVYQQIGVDQEVIQEGSASLVSYFQSKGFFDAMVKTSVQPISNGQSITYQITKGKRHKVEDVEIAGNQHIDEDDLMPHVAVEKGRLFSHGKFSDKLVRTTIKNLEGVYRAAGYSTVKVTSQVKNRGGDIDVRFLVNEGPRDTVEALVLKGNDSQSVSSLAPKGLKVVAGQPYSQKLVDEDRAQIMSRYLDLGYLTATLRARLVPEKDDPHRVTVTYEIYEGPQVKTASVITLGRVNTQQQFINKNSSNAPGKPLSERDMLDSESRLYTPGIFDWAEVDPRRQITTQSSEDVVVKVHEAKRNSLVYGGGFEVINRGGSVPSGTVAVPGLPPVGLGNNFKTSEKTFWGPRGTVEFTRKNIRGKAETFTIGGLAGRLDQRASTNYQIPNFLYTSWASTFTISGEHNSQNPIFTSRLGEAGFQLQKAVNAKNTKNLFLRYNYRQTRVTNLLIPDLVPSADLNVRLSTLSATYIDDSRDSALDAHKGMYQSYELAITPSALGSSVDFARFLGQASYYQQLPKQIIWANSVRLGVEKPFSNSHVPISEAFFSGGGSTLRGFPLNGAGPQRTITACGNPSDPSTCSPITVPVGGNQLFIINSEFRIPVPIKKGLGVVGFYDGGNVFPAIGFHGQYTNSVGFGIRYATPVGPVRIDIGHNLNAQPGIKATQYFITLGQAF